MADPFHYRHSGLNIASSLELPEWDAFACEPRGPDVRILISDEPCPDCPSDGSVAIGKTLRFAIDEIGGWQVEGGHIILVHPGIASGAPELRLFTLGSAWAALGYQRHFAMWHGSAVETGGHAILFCGDAGAGKSTIAAALCAGGARLVADDLSRIELRGGGAVIHPSSAHIKLWRDAIDHFGWRDRILQRDYYREDKFHCAVARHCAGEPPVPLAGVVLLAEGDRTDLERLSGRAAFEAVMQGTVYRPEMLEAMGQSGSQESMVASILAGVSVWRWTRPLNYCSSSLEFPLDGVLRSSDEA